MAMRIFTTFLVWILTYPVMIVASVFVVPVMLFRGWDGYTTWFGNYKYGKYGNKAYPCTNQFCSWWFLVIRNPISNFGKHVLSVKSTATWPWCYDVQMFKWLWIKAGWKTVVDPAKNPDRTFIFRPYFKRS